VRLMLVKLVEYTDDSALRWWDF